MQAPIYFTMMAKAPALNVVKLTCERGNYAPNARTQQFAPNDLPQKHAPNAPQPQPLAAPFVAILFNRENPLGRLFL